MRKKIQIINGANLNLLGVREPEVYGTVSFDTYFNRLRELFSEVELSCFQSNHEGELIDKLHEVGFSFDGIVLNPAAHTHYSYALADAIKAISTPVVEVHLSDITTREPFRRVSVTAPHCVHQIYGKGLDGYREAIARFLKPKDF